MLQNQLYTFNEVTTKWLTKNVYGAYAAAISGVRSLKPHEKLRDTEVKYHVHCIVSFSSNVLRQQNHLRVDDVGKGVSHIRERPERAEDNRREVLGPW